MCKRKESAGPTLCDIFFPRFIVLLVVLLAGCVDEPWVKDYVSQELEPLKAERLKPLEEGLAETRGELQSLRKEVEEIRGGFKPPESLGRILQENREELEGLREHIKMVDARLTALESEVQGLAKEKAELEIPPETILEPTTEQLQEEVPEETRPSGAQAQVSPPLEGNHTALANELRRLRARIDDVSGRIEHIDKQYQQYHGEVGNLRVDIMNEIDTLNDRISVLDEKILDLKDTQKAILAEMAERSQRDIGSIGQRLRELIRKLPGKRAGGEEVRKEEVPKEEAPKGRELKGEVPREVQKKEPQAKEPQGGEVQGKGVQGNLEPLEQKLRELIKKLPGKGVEEEEVRKEEVLKEEAQSKEIPEEGVQSKEVQSGKAQGEKVQN